MRYQAYLVSPSSPHDRAQWGAVPVSWSRNFVTLLDLWLFANTAIVDREKGAYCLVIDGHAGEWSPLRS